MTAEGNDETHVKSRIMQAEIIFGQHRQMLRSNRLQKWLKVATYADHMVTLIPNSDQLLRGPF